MNDAMVRNMGAEELVREAEYLGLGDDALSGRLIALVQTAIDGEWEEQYLEVTEALDGAEQALALASEAAETLQEGVLASLFEAIEGDLFTEIEGKLHRYVADMRGYSQQKC